MRIFVAIVISFCMLASGAHGQTSKDQGAIRITRSGLQPSRQGPAENFTGSARVDPLFQANAPARTSGSLVTFEPGARTAWHTHPLGQILIVTAGTGRVQRWGNPVEEIREGGRGLDSARSEALARRGAGQFNGAHRRRRTARRQGRGMDG